MLITISVSKHKGCNDMFCVCFSSLLIEWLKEPKKTIMSHELTKNGSASVFNYIVR